MKSRRKFTKDFKQSAVSRLNSGQSVVEVARALEVHPSDLQRWRRELQEHGEQAFIGVGKKRAEESRVAELERKVGQLWRCRRSCEQQATRRKFARSSPVLRKSVITKVGDKIWKRK